MAYATDMGSCALREIQDLPDTGDKINFASHLREILTSHVVDYDNNYSYYSSRYSANKPRKGLGVIELPSHFIFTQSNTAKAGNPGVPRFAKWIEENKLGSVIKSESNKSTFHNTTITVYVWAVNRRAVTAWVKKNWKKDN